MASYELILQNKTTGKVKKTPVAGDNSTPKNTSGGESSGDPEVSLSKIIVSYNHFIKPFVNQVVNQRVSTIALRTGAQEHEERMSYSLQVAQKVGGIVTSIAIGAAVGNLPGAITGAVMSIATTSVDLLQKKQRLAMERTVENIGLNYMNMRAGGSVASFARSRQKTQ